MTEKNSSKHGDKISRRNYLKLLGWSGLSASAFIAGLGNFLYLKPAVDYGPPSRFRAGKPLDYQVGIKQIFEKERVVVVREKEGFAAVSLVCTHLGCTIRTSDAGFECPCHGSQYDNDGYVTGGPAPRPLDWFQVSVAPNGDLEIDKSAKVQPRTYFKA
jgi:cytochrome b6-f complex iron-sulfur subunit